MRPRRRNAAPSIFAYDSGQYSYDETSSPPQSPELLDPTRRYAYDDRADPVQMRLRVLASVLAAKAADDYVNLASKARTTHILHGDATGGGHLWPGLPGKTPCD